MRLLTYLFTVLVLFGAGFYFERANAQNADDAVSALAAKAGFSESDAATIRERLGMGKKQSADNDDGDDRDEDYDDDGDGQGKSKSAKGKGNGRGDGLPPGLAKRDQLPPGLAKMETLPPGLTKSPLPASLEEDLGPPPAGLERFLVNDENVVLVDKETGQVVDIIEGTVDQSKLETEKKASETRAKGKGAAGDGNPDKPVVSGNVPNNSAKEKGKGKGKGKKKKF